MLSDADTQLLDAAVCRVAQFDRAFAKSLWGVSKIATTRRLQKLEKRKLIKSRNVLVSTPPSITESLCWWKPGDPSPHSGKISYRAKLRWKNEPLRCSRVYFATSLGRALLGRAAQKPPKEIQATHDLGLSAVYLYYLRKWPNLTLPYWQNESEYARLRGRCVKVEDAILCKDNRVLMMIDYAGAYRPDRVEALLEHAKSHNVPIAIY